MLETFQLDALQQTRTCLGAALAKENINDSSSESSNVRSLGKRPILFSRSQGSTRYGSALTASPQVQHHARPLFTVSRNIKRDLIHNRNLVIDRRACSDPLPRQKKLNSLDAEHPSLCLSSYSDSLLTTKASPTSSKKSKATLVSTFDKSVLVKEKTNGLAGMSIELDCSDLCPQTYKLADGQITILESGRILIDLRQRERGRRGLGVKVLVIDPTKDKVQFCHCTSSGRF